jgi:hypothetical protein
MSYYSGLTYRKPSNYKNMSSTQMNYHQPLNTQTTLYQENQYQSTQYQENQYQESNNNFNSNQGFESRDDYNYNYNYDESDHEEEIFLDSDNDSDNDLDSNLEKNLQNNLQNNSYQLRGDVNLVKDTNFKCQNKSQNYCIGNEITNPKGLSPDENGFYNSYGEYETKYRDVERNQQNIDLEKNNFGCTVLGSSPNMRHQSLYNKVENYCSYIEENMSQAITNLKDLVLNN